MTIVECIKSVLAQEGRPLSISQIYELIIERNLYVFNAKEPKTVIRQQVRRHCAGLYFPSALPNKFFRQDDKGKYVLVGNGISDSKPVGLENSKEKIPEENIQHYHEKHIEQLRSDLLDKMLNVDPSFFEQLVLDLLFKMGYGCNGSMSRRGGWADGGIDGEILQDKLGFDRIYTQAKRYALHKPVCEDQIRNFVGALKNISKGVFITTSRFTKPALKYAHDQQQKTLVLIDGKRLAELMVDFELGVQTTHLYSTYRLDSDYFGDN